METASKRQIEGGGAPCRRRSRRQRRCLATGRSCEERDLIRFVIGPDGRIVPDLAGKLPGRGLWVGASREALDAVIRKGGFGRAARRSVRVPPDLGEQVEALLAKRCLDRLGLACRMGAVVHGYEKVVAALRKGQVRVLIEAADGAADSRRKVFGAMRAAARPPRIVGCFGRDELGLALGRHNVVHAALTAGRMAERFFDEVGRLQGFRRLVPENWEQNAWDQDRSDQGRISASSAAGTDKGLRP